MTTNDVRGARRSRGALLMGVTLLLAGGCLGPRLADLTDGLNEAAARHPDPSLVGDALPAYLLLMDAMVVNRPHHLERLLGAAELYTTYASLSGIRAVTEVDGSPPGGAIAAARALDYAMRAWRVRLEKAPDPRASRFSDLEQAVTALGEAHLPLLYTLGAAWTAWCRHHPGNILAGAELPRAELMLKRVVDLDPAYRDGAALVLLGAMAATLPEEMGGDLEASRGYFEKALGLEHPTPLARLLYARTYAVAIQDRSLFERLLESLLPADAETSPPSAFADQARALLQKADALFGTK